MSRILKHNELHKTKIACNYGGWMYCNGCNKTIGYLCYVTYDSFKFDYKCKCGNCGSVTFDFDDTESAETCDNQLTTIKNRLCCPEDNSPLVTILTKNFDEYKCEIVCKACHSKYKLSYGQ